MNNQDLFDIYGHWHVPFWQTAFFKIGLIITVGAILGALLMYSMMRWYKNRQMPPSVKALRALKELQQKSMQTRDDVQRAYFKMTDILKTFFQAHYNKPFQGMTDQEMIDALQKTSFEKKLAPLLEKSIVASMGVKYAQENALRDELMHHISTAQIIIEHITKQENSK